MSFNATNSTHIHIFGDSITAGQGIVNGVYRGPWYNVAGGFQDQFYAATHVPAPKPYYANSTASVGKTIVSGQYGQVQSVTQQNITAYGVGGKTSGDVLAAITQYILVWGPIDILIGEIGTNDFGTGVAAATYVANMTSVYSQVHAAMPTCKILHFATPVRGEQWTHVGPHLVDGLDTWAGNTGMASLCAANPTYMEYVDILAPALTFEVANNLPEQGVTPFQYTYDSLHPTDPYKVVMAAVTLGHLTIS